jgi:hypothetical protein
MSEIESQARRDLKHAAENPYDAPDAWQRGVHDPLRAEDWAHAAARGIVANLSDRGGIKFGFQQVEESVRIEIVQTLAAIIRLAGGPRADAPMPVPLLGDGGVELISNERKRQIEEEGYSTEHDDHHGDFSLAMAAACYASPELIYIREDYMDGAIKFRDPWPWDQKFDKRRVNGVLHSNTPFARSYDERVRQLAKAGALIAAELDRMKRRHGLTYGDET